MSLNLEHANKMQHWRIFQKWASAKTFVGVVAAPDPDSAIQEAVERYGITNPANRRCLQAELREL